jgi:hypothetical protein
VVVDFIGHVPLGAVVGIRLKPPQSGKRKALFSRVLPLILAEEMMPFGVVGPIGPDRDELISIIHRSHKLFSSNVMKLSLIIAESHDYRHSNETSQPTSCHISIIFSRASAPLPGGRFRIPGFRNQGARGPDSPVETAPTSRGRLAG